MLEELIRREFNRWAEQGRGRGMDRSPWEITRQIIESMNIGPHDNVMDLGCGAGWATRVLAQRASRGLVLGIDLSDRMIAQANAGYRNPPNALFLVASPAGIPCPPDFFSSLLSVETIYYYPDIQSVFNEVFRILLERGKAHFMINYYQENIYSHAWAKHVDIPLQLLGIEDYVGLLSNSGFRASSHRRIINSTPLPEDWTPTHWFPTRLEQERFQAEGALLLTAEK